MKLTILILLCIPLLGNAKGKGGTYFITGTACDKNKNRLTNTLIQVDFRGQVFPVYTDENGNYKLSILWGTSCPNNLTREERRNFTRNANPKWITLTSNDKTVRLKNKWRRYQWKSTQEEHRLTRRKNLVFG